MAYPPRRKPPLAPSTESAYARVIHRAFGAASDFAPSSLPDLSSWGRGPRLILRAALIKRGFGTLAERIEIPYAIQHAPSIPDEDEAKAYEAVAQHLLRGPRAVALLPLRLGLRAAEVLSIPRAETQSAVKTGRLKVLTKGGKERFIKCTKVKALLQDLLSARPKLPRAKLRGPKPQRKERWEIVAEIISTGTTPKAHHAALLRLIKRTGKQAGIVVRPHLLRHAFATRLARDGASPFVVQRALGHASIQTTMRYVHPTESDVEKYLR